MKYTTIFLDLDDTLLDTVANAHDTLEEVYNEFKLKKYYQTFPEFAEIFFMNNNKLWKQYGKGEIEKEYLLRTRFRLPFVDIDEITDEIASEMNQYFLSNVVQKKKIIDGSIEILNYLKDKGYKLHVISNGFTQMQYVKIENSGMNGYFDKVILSDVVGINKPHPDIFHFALNEANATVEESIMIGDNIIADIKGANGIGMDTIWFNPNNKDSEGVISTYEIKKLSEIQNIL